MPGYGNPFPLHMGGGPSPEEKAYAALRSLVGEGGHAPGQPHEHVVELWRWARARGLAAAWNDERALMQVSPQTATDCIPVFEQILRRFSAPGTSDEERRAAVTPHWVSAADATGPVLSAALAEISPLFEVITISEALTRDTQHGRAFQDHNPNAGDASGPAFSGRKETVAPNYSDRFRYIVKFNIAPADMQSDAVRQQFNRARDLLDRVLPAWCSFTLYVSCGFVLDVDLLDITAFCS